MSDFARISAAVMGAWLATLLVRADPVFNVKIPDSGQFLAGDPIALDVSITNASADMAGYHVEDFSVALDQAKSDGIEVYPPVESDQIEYFAPTELKPGTSRTEVFFLNHFLTVSKPGNYWLHIKISLSCTRKGGKDTLESTEHFFALKALPEDAQKTNEDLKTAARQILADSDRQKLEQDVGYLMYFRDPRLIDTAESTFVLGDERD